MAAAALKFLTVPATTTHSATVIFIHGLGDTGHGWKHVADMFCASSSLSHVKWILPHAPEQSVSAHGGEKMPSWFDIFSFHPVTKEDEAGMLESRLMINQLIDQEVNSGTDPGRIVLGGFSQGGSMSLLTGLTYKHGLAGVAVLSGWVPLHHEFMKMTSPFAPLVPVFWGHGSLDPIVRIEICNDSAAFLTDTLKMPLVSSSSSALTGLSMHKYNGMGHTTSARELNDLREWIEMAIPRIVE